MRSVVAKTMKEMKNRHVVPSPSQIDGNAWEVTETWYTCTMKAPDLDQVRTLLMEGLDRERVLFIGTQFRFLYTFMYSPA